MKVYMPEGTPAEMKRARNKFLQKNSKDIALKADGVTPMDALKKGNPVKAGLRALFNVAKHVDDSMVDPAIKRFKGLMSKIKKK